MDTKGSERLIEEGLEVTAASLQNECQSSKGPQSGSSAKPTTVYGCCICTAISIAFTLGLILFLLTGFVVFYFIPYPTIDSIQTITLGDTVPIYFTNFTDIPNGPNTYWYKSITIRVEDDMNMLGVPINFTFVKGQNACVPLANRKKMESCKLSNVDMRLSRQEVLFGNRYMTADSKVTVNINRTDSESSTAYIDTITSCNEYDFIRSFSLVPGSSETITLTFPFSSYCFSYLWLNQAKSTARSLTVDYEYKAVFSYYNITNYGSKNIYQSCTIGPGTLGNDNCDFKLAQRKGCLFVSSLIPENGVPKLFSIRTLAEHEKFTIPSVVCLTFAGAFFILFVFCVTVYGCQVCRSKRKY